MKNFINHVKKCRLPYSLSDDFHSTTTSHLTTDLSIESSTKHKHTNNPQSKEDNQSTQLTIKIFSTGLSGVTIKDDNHSAEDCIFTFPSEKTSKSQRKHNRMRCTSMNRLSSNAIATSYIFERTLETMRKDVSVCHFL